MKWMLWGRRHGKTYQTIQWFLEDPENRVIITAYEDMADDLRRQVSSLVGDALGPFDVTAREYWNTLLKRNIRSYSNAGALRGRRVSVAVDNLDHILSQMFAGNTVELVTATGVNELPVGLIVSPGYAEMLRRKD